MRHRKTKKLQKGYGKSRRLEKSLAAALILYEKITTTANRGKYIRAHVEHLITKGKAGSLHKNRQLFAQLPQNAARKVFEVLGPKYKDRAGGYTRMVKVAKAKDGTTRVQVELI
jgi:large subunit ribosomal protein L17